MEPGSSTLSLGGFGGGGEGGSPRRLQMLLSCGGLFGEGDESCCSGPEVYLRAMTVSSRVSQLEVSCIFCCSCSRRRSWMRERRMRDFSSLRRCRSSKRWSLASESRGSSSTCAATGCSSSLSLSFSSTDPLPMRNREWFEE
eukprot:scaffold98017_cov54-Attheya_sp.AAC.1